MNGDYIMKMWEQQRNFKKFIESLKDQEAKWKKKTQEVVI
jgi:hypothetical protein